VETVTFTVEDTANGNVPVPDLLLNVYDDTGTVLITYQRTDTSGEVTLVLTPDDYIIRMYKPGYSSTDSPVTVADTGGATPQTATVYVQGIIVSAPASPMLCRLYADLVNMDGTPLSGMVVQVRNLFDPSADAGLTMLEDYKEFTTDAVGHVEFDVVRGSRVRVAFVGSSLSRDLKVPDVPVENLTTVFGQATDNFQVVTQ